MELVRVNQHIDGEESYHYNEESDAEKDTKNYILRHVAILLQLHIVRQGCIAVLIH